MNKAELIAAVAEKAGLSKKDSEAAVTAALDAITAALEDGDKVQLVGFGSFEVNRDPRLQGPRSQGRQGLKGHCGKIKKPAGAHPKSGVRP